MVKSTQYETEYHVQFSSESREKIPSRRSRLHSHRSNRTGGHGGLHRRAKRRYGL